MNKYISDESIDHVIEILTNSHWFKMVKLIDQTLYHNPMKDSRVDFVV